ncbi:MAG: DUF4430 domain-containing protein [Candidatus Doudnabacteria bacterium]|nr:DUF4430 domain-containing protein [Candidatus Doudnabacteria bacterium]
MRTKLSILLAVTAVLLPSLSVLSAYNQDTAQNYLETHADNPWSTMALSVLGASSIPTAHLKNITGSSAVEYEAPILAITALGQDPRTFGSSDYVAVLKSYHNSGQVGDPATLNDDIFGILALVAAGQPTTDPVISDAKNFLLSHQDSDGGWGFITTAGSDTNMTASAILALLASGTAKGESAVESAKTYLQNAQNSDGGFPYDPRSPFGTASDSSSTAWVIWALNSLGINPTTWAKPDGNPVSYLKSLQNSAGYFGYQDPLEEQNSFSPVTTAYAVIALEGKFLPVNIFSPPRPAFDFRIEGSQETVCEGRVAGLTAMDIVKNASLVCGFTYNITNTSFGPYLDRINSDTASGLTGWLYLVDYIPPSVGAADYVLEAGDFVLWYFGDWGWPPTRLSLSAAEVATSDNVIVTVEAYNNNVWSPLAEATVFFGAQSATTNSSGQVTINPPEGFYKVFAEKQGYVRSNKVLLKVGSPPIAQVSLLVNVGQGSVSGIVTPPPDIIAFTVAPSALDFGSLPKGGSASRPVTISNTGNVNIHLESVVSGDPLFVDELTLDAVTWRIFEKDLTAGATSEHAAGLAVPQGYSGGVGSKSGQLIFWAVAQ